MKKINQHVVLVGVCLVTCFAYLLIFIDASLPPLLRKILVVLLVAISFLFNSLAYMPFKEKNKNKKRNTIIDVVTIILVIVFQIYVTFFKDTYATSMVSICRFVIAINLGTILGTIYRIRKRKDATTAQANFEVNSLDEQEKQVKQLDQGAHVEQTEQTNHIEQIENIMKPQYKNILFILYGCLGIIPIFFNIIEANFGIHTTKFIAFIVFLIAWFLFVLLKIAKMNWYHHENKTELYLGIFVWVFIFFANIYNLYHVIFDSLTLGVLGISVLTIFCVGFGALDFALNYDKISIKQH